MAPKKHPGGRPPKYINPEDMQRDIDAYFESCWVDDGQDGAESKKQVKPYTMCGLANALDMTRQSLINYSNKDEFFDTIKKAREKVHQFVEEYLFQGKNTAGAIFNLKNNFGWFDKTEHEITGRDGGPIEFSDTERAARLAAILHRVRNRRDRSDNSE